MTSVRHDSMTRFMSRGRQCHFEGSIRRCGSRGHKPRTRMGLRGGYQVRPDLVTRAECIKVSRGAGIPERTVTHVYKTCYLLFILYLILSLSLSDTGGNSSDVPVATLFPGTATMDGTFTDDMNDPESEAFKNVERNFCERVIMCLLSNVQFFQWM